MNKQRYLAELQRLLVFMTAEDRAEAVRRYAALFDAAGPEGEAALVERIGSPTKAAISLSRGYEPGKLPDALPEAPQVPARPKAALTQNEDDPWGDLPTYDLPDYVPPETAGEAPGEAPAPEHSRSFAMPDLPGSAAQPEPLPEKPAGGIPLGLGIPLFILVFAALGLPLGAVCLALFLALLVPGAGVLFGSWLTAVGGLWCMGYLADACLLFGAALIVLAAGLLVLFGGLWLGVKLAGLYVQGVRWIAGELLTGRRTADE